MGPVSLSFHPIETPKGQILLFLGLTLPGVLQPNPGVFLISGNGGYHGVPHIKPHILPDDSA